MINEDTIRVCKKHNGAIKILKELKKNELKGTRIKVLPLIKDKN